jgi:single-strand DNA-binding protein
MFQKLVVVGNLGQDPDMRYMPDGRAVTNFSVATNRKWTNSDGSKGEETTWFRIAVWGNQAEACNQYLSKGRRVLVVGRLASDPQTGGPQLFERRDGSMGAAYNVTAQSVQFLSSNGTGGSPEPETADDGDDIPF